jgi:hypothetical protein
VGTLEELKGRLEEVEQQGREVTEGRAGLGVGGVGRSGIPKRAVSVMSRVTG